MKNFFLILFIPLFTSCAANFTNKTDYRLCYDIATKPSYNFYTSARKKEITKRGVNCKKFANRIDEEQTAEIIASASAPKIINKTYIKNSDDF